MPPSEEEACAAVDLITAGIKMHTAVFAQCIIPGVIADMLLFYEMVL